MPRNYSSIAVDTTLTAGINSSVTSLSVAALTGFPSTPFLIRVDADTANEELCLVTGVVGTTLTVTRGYDSTPAVAHSSGATVRHSVAAIDFREMADHIGDTEGHGVTSPIVGEDDTQTLTNKTIDGVDNTLTNIPTTAITGLELVAVPVGSVLPYAGATAPDGWLICDGASLNQADYPLLFAAIGTAYGQTGGPTSFDLPDLRGRVPVGQDTSQSEFNTLGEEGGSKTHTLTEAQIPTHVHSISHTHTNAYVGTLTFSTLDGSVIADPAAVRVGFDGSRDTVDVQGLNVTIPSHSGNSGSAGSGQSHNNIQPYVTLNYIICVGESTGGVG